MVHVQSIFIAFLLFILCPSLAFAQTSKELRLEKLEGDKEVGFENNKGLRVVTSSGEVIKGRIAEVNGQTLVFADGTRSVHLDSIIHLRRTALLRPVASVLATGGDGTLRFRNYRFCIEHRQRRYMGTIGCSSWWTNSGKRPDSRCCISPHFNKNSQIQSFRRQG